MLRVTFKTMSLIELRFLRKHADLTGSNLYGPDKMPKMAVRSPPGGRDWAEHPSFGNPNCDLFAAHRTAPELERRPQYSCWLIKRWLAEYAAMKKGAVKVTGAKGGPRLLGSGERELQNS